MDMEHLTPTEKREITVAQNRVGKEKKLFEELTIEGRGWSDQNLWTAAAGWFMKAARKAQDVANAQDALYQLLVAAEMKKKSVAR